MTTRQTELGSTRRSNYYKKIKMESSNPASLCWLLTVFLFIEAGPTLLGLGHLRRFCQITPHLCLPRTTGSSEFPCLVMLSDAVKTLGHVTGNTERKHISFKLLALLYLFGLLKGELGALCQSCSFPFIYEGLLSSWYLLL